MLYLASQFAWFLAAAFGLGLVMGWIGQDGGKLRLGGAVTGWFATLWALGAALTWLQFLNGQAAIWVETALLFSGVYVAGCIVAALLRGARPSVEIEQPVTVAPAQAPPPVEGEADIPGTRPAGLIGAKDDRPDDLKQIKGIGRQNEDRFAGARNLAFRADRRLDAGQCRMGRQLSRLSGPDRARGLGGAGENARRGWRH